MFSHVGMISSASLKVNNNLNPAERISLIHRPLDDPILGPKFGPIPNAKKYVISAILDKKFPI